MILRNLPFPVLLTLATSSAPAATTITKTNYHGWPNSYLISNETAEIIVVPAIGRVMQFRLAGDTEGPFWENRAMDGKSPIPTSKEWGNFGGDKTWPAPQSDWPKTTPRSWPPPTAFDSLPVEARLETSTLRLITQIDPHYGIRAERHITLHPAEAQMTIKTTYHKIEGDPQKVSIWIITQLNDPHDVIIHTATDKYVKQSDELPMDLRFEKDRYHLKRHAAKSTKIGTTASLLEWRSSRLALTIESPRIPGADYPDENSSAEVYTNPNPLTYIELEFLGPLHTLKPGDQISQTNTYTLTRLEK